jgi:hypothetical protein
MSEPAKEKKSDFPYDADQARVDIELTREELGDTVEVLAQKVNVPARAREQVEQVADRVREKVPDPVVEQAEQFAVAIRRNPLPVVGAVLVGFFVIRRLARRRKS